MTRERHGVGHVGSKGGLGQDATGASLSESIICRKHLAVGVLIFDSAEGQPTLGPRPQPSTRAQPSAFAHRKHKSSTMPHDRHEGLEF